MSDYGTIKIPRDEYDRHNERRQEMGLSWADYIDGEAPVSNGAEVDAEELGKRIVDQIGSDVGGPKVDDSEIARAVARELDYTELADRVAERVVAQLR